MYAKIINGTVVNTPSALNYDNVGELVYSYCKVVSLLKVSNWVLHECCIKPKYEGNGKSKIDCAKHTKG
jgi:hypothetical protein